MAPKTVTRHRVSTPHHPWTMGGSRYHRQRRRCTHPRAYPRTYQHPTSDSFPLDASPFVVSAVAIWTPIQRMHARPYYRPPVLVVRRTRSDSTRDTLSIPQALALLNHPHLYACTVRTDLAATPRVILECHPHRAELPPSFDRYRPLSRTPASECAHQILNMSMDSSP